MPLFDPALRSRPLLAAFAAAAAVLTVVTLANLHLPLVRNGITYARTAQAIVDADFDVLAVNGDAALLYGRPIGFPAAASPLVAALGATRGLKLASLVSTVLFVWIACAFLVRVRREAGLEPGAGPVDVMLLAFNPLVVYQAWSAHPDALFSAAFLVALMLAASLVGAGGARRVLLACGLAATIYAAIELKYYGAILVAIVPAWSLVLARGRLDRVVPALAASGAALVLVAAGFAGLNPTLNLGTVAGMDRYEDALTDAGTFALYSAASLVLTCVFLLVVCGPAIGLLARRPPRGRVVLGLLAVCAIFAAGLLPFRGTGYNMRYFLPLLPVVVLLLVEGLRASPARRRAIIVAACLGVQSVLVVNFNVRPVYEALRPVNEALERVRWPGTRRVMAVFDSLRLGHHVAAQELVEFIGEEMRPGETLVYVTDYYRDAAHRFFEDERLVARGDVTVRYEFSLRQLAVDQPPGPYWLCARCDEILVAPPAAEVSEGLGRRVVPAGRVMRVE